MPISLLPPFSVESTFNEKNFLLKSLFDQYLKLSSLQKILGKKKNLMEYPVILFFFWQSVLGIDCNTIESVTKNISKSTLKRIKDCQL